MARDFINMNQIAVFKNNKVLIEFNDNFQRAKLSPEDITKLNTASNIEETPRKSFSKIHDVYSGITVVASDYSNGKGDTLVSLNLRLTADNAKLINAKLCNLIEDRKSQKRALDMEIKAYEESGKFFKAQYTKYKDALKEEKQKPEPNAATCEELKEKMNFANISFGNAQAMYYATKKKIELFAEYTEVLFNEQKIMPTTIDGTDYSKVTTFKVEYNAKMNNPITIYVENGKGIKELTNTGGSKIKSGTYTDRKLIKLFLTEDEVLRIFKKVSDYSIAWEIGNINAAIKEKQMVKDKERTFNNQTHN